MPNLSIEATRQVARTLLGEMGAPTDHASIVADHLASCHLAGTTPTGCFVCPSTIGSSRREESQRPKSRKSSVKPPRPPSSAAVGAGGRSSRSWRLPWRSRKRERLVSRSSVPGIATMSVDLGPTRWRQPKRVYREALVQRSRRCPDGSLGSIDARFGTNPMAIAIPRRERPILVDITTTAVAEGKVRLARNQGKSIPEGWVLDKEGKATTRASRPLRRWHAPPLRRPAGTQGIRACSRCRHSRWGPHRQWLRCDGLGSGSAMA